MRRRVSGRWRGSGVGEPWSWLLALAALMLGVGGLEAFTLRGIASGLVSGIVIGFVVHEAAHRNVARRAGMYSEFVASPIGVLITAASAVSPIKILAPGYVQVWGYRFNPTGAIRSVEAGPLSNIVLSTVFTAASLLALQEAHPRLHSWLLDAGGVNAWLALFNLIPVPPLDGYKLFNSTRRRWALLILASTIIYLLYYVVP